MCERVCERGGGGSGPPVPPLDLSMVNIYDTHTRRSAAGSFYLIMCLSDRVSVLMQGGTCKIYLLVCATKITF